MFNRRSVALVLIYLTIASASGLSVWASSPDLQSLTEYSLSIPDGELTFLRSVLQGPLPVEDPEYRQAFLRATLRKSPAMKAMSVHGLTEEEALNRLLHGPNADLVRNSIAGKTAKQYTSTIRYTGSAMLFEHYEDGNLVAKEQISADEDADAQHEDGSSVQGLVRPGAGHSPRNVHALFYWEQVLVAEDFQLERTGDAGADAGVLTFTSSANIAGGPTVALHTIELEASDFVVPGAVVFAYPDGYQISITYQDYALVEGEYWIPTKIIDVRGMSGSDRRLSEDEMESMNGRELGARLPTTVTHNLTESKLGSDGP